MPGMGMVSGIAAAYAHDGNAVDKTAAGVASGRELLSELAVEYVRVKEVVQLGYTPLTSDAAAVGAFLSGRKELLLLAGRPD